MNIYDILEIIINNLQLNDIYNLSLVDKSLSILVNRYLKSNRENMVNYINYCIKRNKIYDSYYFKKPINSRDIVTKLNEKSLALASRYGCIEIVKLALENGVDPTYNNDEALNAAIMENQLKIVKLLLKDERVSPYSRSNLPIFSAAANGHYKIVKLLLKDWRPVNPTFYENDALVAATFYKHYNIVKLILKDDRNRVNMKYNNYKAIQFAKENEYDDIFQLLNAQSHLISI